MIATGLNLVNPQSWVPESQKTDVVFGESPEERVQRHAREQFGGAKPLIEPPGRTAIDPEGSDLARLSHNGALPSRRQFFPLHLPRQAGR